MGHVKVSAALGACALLLALGGTWVALGARGELTDPHSAQVDAVAVTDTTAGDGENLTGIEVFGATTVLRGGPSRRAGDQFPVWVSDKEQLSYFAKYTEANGRAVSLTRPESRHSGGAMQILTGYAGWLVIGVALGVAFIAVLWTCTRRWPPAWGRDMWSTTGDAHKSTMRSYRRHAGALGLVFGAGTIATGGSGLGLISTHMEMIGNTLGQAAPVIVVMLMLPMLAVAVGAGWLTNTLVLAWARVEQGPSRDAPATLLALPGCAWLRRWAHRRLDPGARETFDTLALEWDGTVGELVVAANEFS